MSRTITCSYAAEEDAAEAVQHLELLGVVPSNIARRKADGATVLTVQLDDPEMAPEAQVIMQWSAIGQTL